MRKQYQRWSMAELQHGPVFHQCQLQTHPSPQSCLTSGQNIFRWNILTNICQLPRLFIIVRVTTCSFSLCSDPQSVLILGRYLSPKSKCPVSQSELYRVTHFVYLKYTVNLPFNQWIQIKQNDMLACNNISIKLLYLFNREIFCV